MRASRKMARLASLISVMILTSSLCTASPVATVGLSGGLESFHLKEFDNSGTRLLSESGNRYVTTAFLDNGDKYELQTRLLYHAEISAYWGRVDYDGKSQSIEPAQSNLPLSSQTDYQGGRGEAMAGYRIPIAGGLRALDIIGGLGFDIWSRSIHSAVASNGTLVSGIKEIYNAYYGKAALGLNNLFASTWHNHLEFGIKMPFSISERINLSKVGYDSDLTVYPGNTYSGFISLLIEPPKHNNSGHMVIKVYYDGFRFNPSKTKTVSRNGTLVYAWQPETHIDIFGVQLGYRF